MMNLRWNIFKRLGYDQEDLQKLTLIQNAHPELLKLLHKLIVARLKDTKPSQTMTEGMNYTARRAFLDGRAFELEWLEKLLSEGEHNESDRDDHLGRES